MTCRAERCAFPYHVIAVASDLLPAAKRPFRHALALARCHGAAVHLVHVVAGVSEGRSLFGLPLGHSPELVERARARGWRRMEDFLRGEDLEGIEFHRVVRAGRPADEILRYAGEAGADLLVVGARSSETLRGHLLTHLPFEGVSAELRRRCPLSVLVVR